jgi:hypothetical protein
MDGLINFFALRPTFTYLGLQMVWYIYLLNTLVQLYTSASGIIQVLSQRGISWEAWSPNFIPIIFGAIAQLLVVRLVFEVAATILFHSRTNSP